MSPADALGVLEVAGLTPAMSALDAMEKAAPVQVLQAELNDLLGVCVKLRGPVAAVRTAIEAGERVASRMGVQVTGHVIARLDDRASRAILSPREFNPLIQQDVVFNPQPPAATRDRKGTAVNHDSGYALGFIETQGFTAVFAAIDTACKAANVEIIGKEKLGGGFVTVVIKGDVASVKAAVEAGRAEAETLGKVIAAHVIPRPSPSVAGLLPAVASLRG